jgi:hypothetical protein
MGNLLLILALLLSSLTVQTGARYEDAVRAMGCEPTFAYSAHAESPDTGWAFSKPMKFGVYGWDLDTSWYGMQTLNDTVAVFRKFGSRKEYKEYVTPPSKIGNDNNQ